MTLLKMAWRNIWRNTRRSVVTILAMSFALTVMIGYSGLVSGYLSQLEANILDVEMGDVQVVGAEYWDAPSVFHQVEDAHVILESLKKEGYPASPRVLGAGLAAAGDQSAGVFFRGVDVTADATVSRVFDKVAHGKWLDSAAKNEVVIGRRLARSLNVKVGAELVVLTQGADGSMANELYKVRGILGTVSEPVDRAGVYMNAADLRALLVIPDGIHKIVIRKPENVSLAFAAEVIKKITGKNAPRTWKEIVPTLSSMLESVEGMIVIMFSIIFVAIGILILNAMLMAVFERIREFGVLKAIGFGPWAVFRLIMAESAILTFIATATGLLVSIPLLWFLSTHGIRIMSEEESLSFAGMSIDPYWYALVNVDTFMTPLKTMLTIVFMAILYPALRAAWIRPIKAIYHH